MLGDERDCGHWRPHDDSCGDDSRLDVCTERAVKDVGYEACHPFLTINKGCKRNIVTPSSVCWAVSLSICGEGWSRCCKSKQII